MQHDTDRRRQVYLGADGHELEPTLRALRDDLDTARAAATDRSSLVSMLGAGGAYVVPAAEVRLLRFIEGAGLFRLGGVLAGTHAFTTYANMLGVRWTTGSVRTRDVDIVHDEHIAVALAEDVGAADLEAARRDPVTGVELWPIPGFDRRSPSTSFKVLGTELHIDLLTPMVGRERTAPVKIAALNAAAQPLRYLDYLVEETQPAAIVGGDGVLVNVPSPARFALHKLLVAAKRKAAQAVKARKDVAQASEVLAVLLEDRPADIRRAFDDLRGRGTGWTKPFREGLARLPDEQRALLAKLSLR